MHNVASAREHDSKYKENVLDDHRVSAPAVMDGGVDRDVATAQDACAACAFRAGRGYIFGRRCLSLGFVQQPR